MHAYRVTTSPLAARLIDGLLVRLYVSGTADRVPCAGTFGPSP